MTCFRMFFDNYVDIDVLAGNSVSSEQTAFPIINAYNRQRRSKVWRSNGYFKVTSLNKQIVLRETIGVDLLATITEGEYISKTAFAAAVKSALELVGDSTYTVTIAEADGFKIKIVSNGAGGGGVFHLMLTDSDFTAASLLGFGTDSDLTDAALARTADFLRISSEEFIEWDMGIATNPKGFAVIGPRNKPISLSPGGTFKLQASYTSNWTTPVFETTITYNDNAFYQTSETGLADEAFRFWRFKIEDQNPQGFVEVGSFMLGDYFDPDRGAVQFPLTVSEVDRTDLLTSEGGQTYSDIKQKTAEYRIRWAGLKKAYLEEFQDQFARYGTGVPFFVAMDSGSVFSTQAQRRLIFCKFATEPEWELVSPNNFELSFTLREDL
jgi:hypothetical protein